MDPIKFTDHAAQQSDRWLLICVLAVCFLCVLWLVRWFVAKLDAQTLMLGGVIKETNETSLKVTQALTSTAATVRECGDYMRENTEFLRQNMNFMRENEHHDRSRHGE